MVFGVPDSKVLPEKAEMKIHYDKLNHIAQDMTANKKRLLEKKCLEDVFI